MWKEKSENILAVVLGIGIIAVVIALIVGIIAGVAWLRRPDFPVSETGFPIGFTRLSDGVQIRLGMTEYEIGRVVTEISEHERMVAIASGLIDENERLYGRTGYIGVTFRPDGTANIVSTNSNQWAIVEGISVGDNVQRIFDNDRFLYVLHSYEDRHTWVIDRSAFEETVYLFSFFYDEHRRISDIALMYMPDFAYRFAMDEHED